MCCLWLWHDIKIHPDSCCTVVIKVSCKRGTYLADCFPRPVIIPNRNLSEMMCMWHNFRSANSTSFFFCNCDWIEILLTPSIMVKLMLEELYQAYALFFFIKINTLWANGLHKVICYQWLWHTNYTNKVALKGTLVNWQMVVDTNSIAFYVTTRNSKCHWLNYPACKILFYYSR